MVLAEFYMARYETAFQAYMALQRALMLRYVQRGGTPERWCREMAPRFRARYSVLLP